MGIMGFLNFTLLCIDFLAWPTFALGYPLCASIRAIETGSKYQMRKLVIYWTLFSLISIFEVAFAKIIEWIPFWSHIKLTLICWLVIPRFDGACHAYQTFVYPCLSVNVQTVMSWLSKPKEEKPLKPESFLDAAEKYIKENGSEALETLIASKLVSKEPNSSQRESQFQEPEEKIAVARPNEPKEADTFQKDIKMSEAWEKSPSAESKQVQHEELSGVALSGKETAEADEVKEVRQWDTSEEKRHPDTPRLKEVQQQWTCALCQVTTTCEKNLNDHLQGSKHKSKFESLKTTKNNTKHTSSPSTTDKSSQGNPKAVKSKTGNGVKQKSSVETEERVQFQDKQKQAKQKRDGAAVQHFKLWCGVCNVSLISEIDLAAHLNGKRHSSNIEKIVKS